MVNWTACGSLFKRKAPKKNSEGDERCREDKTGEFMRSTTVDMDSRLRVATAVEKNETLASQSVFEILRHRGHPDTPPSNDYGWLGWH